MEIAITWLQYGLIIVIILTIYYIVLGIVYFKKEISNASLKGKASASNLSSSAEASTEPEESVDAFFQNQINDNNHDYNQPESDADDHEDFDQKAEQDTLDNEVNDTTPLVPQYQAEQETSHQKYAPPITQTDDTVVQTAQLSAQITEAIAIAVEKDQVREEFIASLKRLLQKYQFLTSSFQRELIHKLITSECEKYGCVQLSAEEQVMLWNE